MKKRILFVEDNPILRLSYELMLKEHSEDWEVGSAENGATALSLLEQGPFDVVVSDFNLPDLSGLDLIKEVRWRHPQTSRIIISGIDDQEEIARCLNETHQFLAKPFDGATLRGTLARLRGLDALLDDARLRSMVARLNEVPSFPSLYALVVRELSAESPSLETVAEAIAEDPGMMAKVLQLANSAGMGLAQRVSSPFGAVQHLGFRIVRSLVLSGHVFASSGDSRVDGFSPDALWEHSCRTAFLAQRIMHAEGADADACEAAFSAAMLHDAGKLLLAQNLPAEYAPTMGKSAHEKRPLHETERECLGVNHAGVGAYLLGLWGLPAVIVEAVGFHHAPALSAVHEFAPLTAVHVANALAHETVSPSSPSATTGLDLDYLAQLGALDKLEEWRKFSSDE